MRFIRAADREVVETTQGPRQADNTRKVQRELLAMHLLHLQFRVRHDCDVGQAVAVGHQGVLVQLPTSSKSLQLVALIKVLNFVSIFSRFRTTFGGTT